MMAQACEQGHVLRLHMLCSTLLVGHFPPKAACSAILRVLMRSPPPHFLLHLLMGVHGESTQSTGHA